jgi:hypothetical protein
MRRAGFPWDAELSAPVAMKWAAMRKTIVAGAIRCYVDLVDNERPSNLPSDNLDPMTTV